jgi:drug/metabolite transporter (DMT)-like permease
VPDRSRLPILAAFAAVYFVWGSTFLAIAWAVETIPPLSMMALRCLIGGSILMAMSRLGDGAAPWPTRREWAGSAVLGLFFFVGCHGLLAHEEQFVPSGVAALCLATIPLFVPLLAWRLTNSGPPTARTASALLAAFAGVALLVVAQGSGEGGLSVVDAGLLLFCSFSWAAGTVLSRIVPVPSSPLAAGGAALLCGGVVLSLMAPFGPSIDVSEISGRSVLGLTYLVLAGTVVTFSAYMWLLGKVAPTRVATYAFVNPAVAVLLGWALADETLNAATLAATAVIVAAVAVAVSARPRPS